MKQRKTTQKLTIVEKLLRHKTVICIFYGYCSISKIKVSVADAVNTVAVSVATIIIAAFKQQNQQYQNNNNGAAATVNSKHLVKWCALHAVIN